MKKILLLSLLAICTVVGASAQNANRSGIFIEAAGGGSIGNGPLIGLSMDGPNLMGYYAGGAVLNLAVGAQFRISDHNAIGFRAEAQSNVSHFTQSLVLKAMPGLRISTDELFANISMYINVNAGLAVADSGKPDFTYYDDRESEHYVVPGDGSVVKWDSIKDASLGVAYEIGVGLNITSRFYGGLVWDAQIMFDQTRDLDPTGILHYGMAGIRLGYRFNF